MELLLHPLFETQRSLKHRYTHQNYFKTGHRGRETGLIKGQTNELNKMINQTQVIGLNDYELITRNKDMNTK